MIDADTAQLFLQGWDDWETQKLPLVLCQIFAAGTEFGDNSLASVLDMLVIYI